MRYVRLKVNDENFGEEIENIIIWNDEEFIIISIFEEEIKIKKYQNINQFIKDFITNKNELEFLRDLVIEQDDEIKKLEEKLR